MILARRFAPPVAVFLAAVGLWYAASLLLLSDQERFLMPLPHDVLVIGFGDPDNLAELLTALALSAQVALVGLVVAFVVAVSLAVAMSQAKWVERSLYPYAVLLQTIPVLALVPLFGFWFGFGFGSRVLVCVLIALFPLIANTLFGLRSVTSAQLDLFRLHGAGRWKTLWKLQFPAALPSIFTGLRISAGLSVIGAVVGDFFFKQGEPGIGILIDLYRSRLQSEQMFAAVLLASALGIAVFWFFGFLAGRVVGSWHESVREPRT
ncbi:ABC transporter permease [Allokutzneria multivorans]|uniref:ABC transporter permease n=1 Tax=Allokutzneria multivorans TaxID=1142134 RepID=A0ABP7R1D6_9PSEU